MNHEATHYDRDFLQRLLDDSLPEQVAGEVADHVADCSDCRRRLETLSGHDQWWTQARDNVKQILADPEAYLSNGDDSVSRLLGSTPSVASDEAFLTDFAVDFLEPSDDPRMLGRLGEYEICEVIGRGGMGIVLKGFQKELNRYVAVKVLAPHLATSGAARRRFAREAQATAAIVNPHVMAIHSVNANAKLPYLVMPFVACESLQQRLDRQGPLEIKDALRIGLQAAAGLAAAHAQGLVHRDVKPANILLETNVDRVMLTDFGLARAVDDATLTRTGIIAGTPQYMSPEQANGDAVDHRSDLFSLGSVLYALCTARPPFRAETTFGVLRRIRETQPRPIREINADIPEWLERLVSKLLEKNAADRIATAAEAASLLEQCLAHVQQPTTVALPSLMASWKPAPAPDAPEAHMPRAARQRGRWIVLAAAVLTAAGMTAFWPAARPTTTPVLPQELPAEPVTNPVLEWDATQIELDATTSSIIDLETTSHQDLESLPGIELIESSKSSPQETP